MARDNNTDDSANNADGDKKQTGRPSFGRHMSNAGKGFMQGMKGSGANHAQNAGGKVNPLSSKGPNNHAQYAGGNANPLSANGANNHAQNAGGKVDPLASNAPINHAQYANGATGNPMDSKGPVNHAQDNRNKKPKSGHKKPNKNNKDNDKNKNSGKNGKNGNDDKPTGNPAGKRDNDDNSNDTNQDKQNGKNNGLDMNRSGDASGDKTNANPDAQKNQDDAQKSAQDQNDDNDDSKNKKPNSPLKMALNQLNPTATKDKIKDAKDVAGQAIDSAKNAAKNKAKKEAPKAAAIGAGGYLGAKSLANVGHAATNAAGNIGSHIMSGLSGIGHSIAGGVKGAIGAVGHGVSGVASSIGLGAGTAGTVGTVTGATTVVGIPVATMVAGVGFLIPMLNPQYNDDTSNCNNAQTEQTQYTANFKITSVGPTSGKHGNVSIEIEKWCASQHLNAAQTAGILGNAMAESTMGTNGAGGGKYGDFLGAGATEADTSHNNDEVADYMNWFVKTFSGGGSGPAPAAWNKYKSMSSSSPHDLGYFFGAHLDVAASHNYDERGQYAEQFYKELTGSGSKSIITDITTAIDNTSIGKAANQIACDLSGKNSSQDTADGQGSIKEDPGDSFIMWNTDGVPSDAKQYIHSPKDVGMGWGSQKGWVNNDSDGQCVPFASSFFYHIWGFKGQIPMAGTGGGTVDKWKSETGGTVSHTPHAGALVSAANSVTPLTGGSGPGHTFVVLHVLKNGDFIIAQQNFPRMAGGFNGSGADVGHPNTWNYGVISHNFLSKYHDGLTFLMPDKNHKLKWTK